MQANRVLSIGCESLESRQLLTAVPFPQVLGVFVGSTSPAGAAASTLVLTVSSQTAGKFNGTAFGPGSTSTPFAGTVNKKGVIHVTVKGTTPKFSTSLVGTLTGDALNGKYTSTAVRHKEHGVFSTNRLAGGIVGTSGQVNLAIPPINLSTGSWESDTSIQAFVEDKNFALPQDVALDITAVGTSPGATDANLSPGTIAAGTVVNCYSLHFDVVGAPATNNSLEATGSITLDQPIVGIILLSDSLNASNAILGIPGDTYPNGQQYGVELDPTSAGLGTGDIVTISADRRTLTVDLHTANSGDNIRILTLAS